MNFEIKRTPEQGHDVACQANALITAIENMRDVEGMTALDFRAEVQYNFRYIADEYLESGSIQCLCDPL